MMDTKATAGKQQKSMKQSLLLWFAPFAALLSLVGGASSALAQTVPAANVIQSKTLIPTINGNSGHIAANSAGDVFFVSQTDNVAYWVKRGTTTPIPILSGLSGGRSVYVDPSNNVYIPSNYSGTITEIPYVAGNYATGSARASLSACTSATPTSPCNQFGNGGAGISYYYQATDLGFDAAGNAYVVDAYNNEGSAGVNKSNAIEKFSYNGVSYAAKVLVNNLPQQTNTQIAVDPAGDVYYADGVNLYSLPAGATTVAPIGTGLMKPSGVTLDKFGNLYVTDSGLNQIIEMPAVNGVAQPSMQFVLDPVYSANGVGIDNLGDMFYTGYSTTTNLNVARINSFNLGSAAVGTPVASSPTSFTLTFSSSQTIGGITLAGAGSGFSYTAGTCAKSAYTATNTCTFSANYTPTSVGLQKGAIVVTNASGAVIATAELLGVGLGAVQTIDPGTVTAITGTFASPQGIAVDAAKDIFIADAGKNTVYEYASGSPAPVSLGTGLSGPTGVALDNAGNLYIADSGNGRVVVIPAVGGALNPSAQAIILSGLGSSLSIATDPYGSLYVSDMSHNAVYQLLPINGIPSTSAQIAITLPSTSVAPGALATDSIGNLFVADTTANTVTEVSYYGKSLTNIGSGYSHPSGLAVDAAGNLYVADPGNIRLIKIPFESPIYNPNDQYSVGPPFTVAAGVSIPFGVALDASANLYVVDNKDATVALLNRQQGTLNLGASNVNTTTAQENSYIGSSGNQSLLLGNPAYTTTTIPAFNVTAPSTGGCANSEALLPGFACILQATFTPPAVGNYTQALNFNSNAANTTNPLLTLTGSGLNVAATTLTLKQTSPAGQAAFGQTVTITSSISSITSGTPSGDVVFYVDGNFYSVVKVTGATQTLNITGLLGGSHTIAASYTGDNTFASSSTTLTIVVVKAGSSVAVAASGGGVFQFPASAASGTNVTLTAVITPNANAVPTGTVTFTAGSATLGTGSVVTVKGAYQASITTTALPAGNNTVLATYTGDVNYAPSSGTLLVVIGPQTFTVTPATQTATTLAGAAAVIPLQVQSVSGFGNAYVSMTCSGLPANTTCGFDPNGFVLQPGNQLTAQQTNGTGTVILVPATYGPTGVALNIITGTTPVIAPPPINAFMHLPGIRGRVPVGLAMIAIMPFTFLIRRRQRKGFGRLVSLSVMVVLLGLGATSLSGCGSNLIGNTPVGTYQVTVTAVATDPSYPTPTTANPLAPGCTYAPTTSTTVTCTQTVQVTLVVTAATP